MEASACVGGALDGSAVAMKVWWQKQMVLLSRSDCSPLMNFKVWQKCLPRRNGSPTSGIFTLAGRIRPTFEGLLPSSGLPAETSFGWLLVHTSSLGARYLWPDPGSETVYN